MYNLTLRMKLIEFLQRLLFSFLIGYFFIFKYRPSSTSLPDGNTNGRIKK